MRRVQRYWKRWTIRYVRRPLRALLSRTTVAIREHIPGVSPLVAWSSRVTSLGFLPGARGLLWPIEMLGADAILSEACLGPLLRLWNSTPFRRAQLDQAGVKTTTDLLKAGGALYVFMREFVEKSDRHQPLRPPGLSVAHLSSFMGVPLVPVGVGGPASAISHTLRWGRARLNPTPLVSPVRAVGEELVQRIGTLVLPAEPARYALDARERVGPRARLGESVVLPAHLRVAPPNAMRRDHYIGSPCDAPRSPPRG